MLNGVNAGSTRSAWALPVLHALTQRPGVALSRADLADILKSRGLRGDLSARQILRVWSALQSMFAEAGVGDALSQRLQHRPRGRTSGPWSWLLQPGDEVRLHAGRAAEQPSDGWCFSHVPDADRTQTLFRNLGEVMALLWKGLPEEAWRLLDEEARWTGASAALLALLSLLRGEVQAKRRCFAEAYAAFDLAQAQVNAGPPSLAFLLEQIRVQRVRARYAEQPAAVYAGLLPELQDLQRRSRGFDPTPLAELLNLELLCLRRKLEAGGDLCASDRAALLGAMERAAMASLFGFMAGRQFERAQCVSSNLAYAYQRVAPAQDALLIGRAMRWYAASTQLHLSLDLSWNSAWEYIFIGELWLSSVHARETAASLSWQGEGPGQAGFYSAGVQEAHRSADPRQQAHAWLNLHGFAVIQRDFDCASAAVQSLHALLARHPDLETLLRVEGYTLPWVSQASWQAEAL
ncbi:MAG: hypothetical protein C0423_06310 [Methylibium sp.]|nr:hypothetical protein [Methylibium sp.]